MTLNEILAPVLPTGKFWTKAWSLVEGCTPVSPGCQNCWLAAMERRLGAKVEKGVTGSLIDDTAVGYQRHTPSPLVSGGSFNGHLVIHYDRLDMPLRKRKPQVFAVWSDLFHESVPRGFQEGAFATMALAPQHYFIIVTKRPAIAAGFVSDWEATNPLSNVVILVTIEDQARANGRAPYALRLAAQGWAVGALCEPLLGPVDLTRIYSEGTTGGGAVWGSWDSALDGRSPDIWGDGPDIEGGPRLSWVITGGESGPGARPCHPDWVRSLRDQAQASEVPFMLKSLGAKQGNAIDGLQYLGVPEI